MASKTAPTRNSGRGFLQDKYGFARGDSVDGCERHLEGLDVNETDFASCRERSRHDRDNSVAIFHVGHVQDEVPVCTQSVMCFRDNGFQKIIDLLIECAEAA
jgi:hypothetical protein